MPLFAPVTLAGDVQGPSDATQLDEIQGVALDLTGLSSGNALTYNGTNWVPETPGGSSGTPNLNAVDHGMAGWTFDSTLNASAGSAPVATAIYWSLLKVQKTGTINNIWLQVMVVPAGLTPNENFLGLYNFVSPALAAGAPYPTAMTLVAATAAGTMDAIGATGVQPFALAAPLDVTEGDLLYVAFLFNGASPPAIGNAPEHVDATYAMPVANNMVYGGARTTLPASPIVANIAGATTANWWAAISS